MTCDNVQWYNADYEVKINTLKVRTSVTSNHYYIEFVISSKFKIPFCFSISNFVYILNIFIVASCLIYVRALPAHTTL